MEPSRSRSKCKTVISWADQVEKEEEEEARAQVYEKLKSNPFGSARPSEVVLHETGIDWGKLDEDLQEPSHLSIWAQKEKPLKENIPALAALAVDRKQMMPQSRGGPEQKLKHMKMDSHGSKVPQIPRSHASGVFVPPLKYPPRARLPNLFPATHCTGPQNLQSKNHIELEKVHRDSEPGIEQFQTCKILGHGRHIHCYNGCHNQHNIVLEHESAHGAFENGRRNFEVKGPPLEAFGKAKVSRKSPNCEGRQSEDSHYRKRTYYAHNLVGSPMAGKRRRALTQNGGRRDDRYTYKEKLRAESERQSSPGKFVRGASMETIVNGGRAETNHITEMKSADSRGNYKKRGPLLRTTNVIGYVQ